MPMRTNSNICRSQFASNTPFNAFSVGACVCMVDFPPSWLDTSCTTKIIVPSRELLRKWEGLWRHIMDICHRSISNWSAHCNTRLASSLSFLTAWARGFVSIFLVILANTLAPPTGYPYIRGYLNLSTDSYVWIKFHFLLVSSRANFKSARWNWISATKTHANSQKYERTSAHTLSVCGTHRMKMWSPLIFWFLAATNKSKQQRRIILNRNRFAIIIIIIIIWIHVFYSSLMFWKASVHKANSHHQRHKIYHGSPILPFVSYPDHDVQ